MNFIQCARSNQEQNLKVLQCNSCLYFEALRDITVSEELLVWYDDTQYDVHMGIPVGHKGSMTAERGLHYGETWMAAVTITSTTYTVLHINMTAKVARYYIYNKKFIHQALYL